MRLSWSTLSEPLVLAAIVATLWVPPGAAIALFGSALLGWSIHSVVTFGDLVYAPVGLVLWWTIGFVPAFVYTVVFMPWPATAPVTP